MASTEVPTNSFATPQLHVPALEIWGGAECTCNRVYDKYFDQMDLSGHAGRLQDYELFAQLGIRTLRVGFLWERHVRDPSWRWSDERLNHLRQLQINPIAGLLHHGSGPSHTSLLDPLFPEQLAEYASAFAERYPWIDNYTPVNEPQTTARFSGLYGLWYPHHTSVSSYLRALINQLKGTVLSMKAIRRVRPDARLIQTEDICRISGTDQLRGVWQQLNLRQWLPYDLLCGRVNSQHPLYRFMLSNGISRSEIDWFAENPCAPSVLGINYYVTSDRYIDDRIHLHQHDRRSAEGPFVDVETVRVSDQKICGIQALLEEAWKRYGIPVAITEVHLGGEVDEQIRWLVECWEGARAARRNGVDCVALTVWALLGSYYWNELVTRDNGHYEAGAFDVRSGSPVATDLASVVAQIAKGQPPMHPALPQRGWWHQPDRVSFAAEERCAS